METFYWKQYLTNYPDLNRFNTEQQAIRHYLRFGKSEGRTDKTICLIVIAKYKEDISFIKKFKYPVKVYDKSKDCINIGREAETYLRYIIDHYDNLPNHVIFLQGNPFDHLPKNFDLFNITLTNSLQHIALHYGLEEWDHTTRTSLAFKTLFDEPLPEKYVQLNSGSQYIVPKHCITCRSLDFYKTIHKVLFDTNNLSESKTNCLVCPWTLERMWPYIFNPDLKVKEIKYQDLI